MPWPPLNRGENGAPPHNPLAIYVVIPMDAFRTKRVQDATSASTFSCLMEHVITFRRLQQTAECLLTTPPPPLSAILKCAEQTRDTGLQEPIHVCGPLLAPVMSLCAAAIQQYTKGAAQLELAVHIVSAAPNTIIDIGGIHSNGKLIARSKDPQALLDAAIIHREAFGWRPTPTQTVRSPL